MGEDCHLEVSIAAPKNPNRDAARVTRCRAGERRTHRTAPAPGSKFQPQKAQKHKSLLCLLCFFAAKIPVMKYLIIGALLSIIFVLVYSRIRPYLKLIQTVASSLEPPVENKTPSRNKLVRCDRCGTWIPAERAMKLNSGLATFCSAECMANKTKERKIAG